jgi:predicted nucleic acid-binding protein
MRGAGPRFAADRARELYSSPTLVILRPAQEDETAAVDLMVKHAGARIGFTDCVSFVLMRKAKIQRAFSFDAHFAEAGFILCP